MNGPALLCGFVIVVAASANAIAKTNPDIGSPCAVRAGTNESITYPVHLRIFGDDARGLGSGVVTIAHPDGSEPITVDCAEPDVIVRLPAGVYIATVDAAGGPAKNLRFRVSSSQVPEMLTLHLAQARASLTIRNVFRKPRR